MNRGLATTDAEKGWALQRYDPSFEDEHDGSAASLDLPKLLAIIREWRWLILAAVAAGLAFALVYAMVSTPTYKASVILQVNPPEVQILNAEAGGQPDSQTPWDAVATQVGLLSSRSLAQRVAQDLDLATDPKFVDQVGSPSQRLRSATSKISANLHTVPPTQSELIEYTYDSDNPVLAAEIANGIADAFITSNLQRRYDSSAYARRFLESQIAKTRKELENSERQLVGYAQAQGIIDSSSDAPASASGGAASSPQGQSLSEINGALSQAIARRVAAEGAYRAALGSGITTTETASSQSLRQSLAGLQAQYQQKQTILKPDHPEMVSLQAQIAQTKKAIERENSSVQSSRINALRSDYEAAAGAERALRSQVAELKSDVLNLRGRSIRYAILQRDVDTNRALYDALLQRYKQIGVAGGIGTSPVSIVDRADVPSAPFKPNLLLDLAVAINK